MSIVLTGFLDVAVPAEPKPMSATRRRRSRRGAAPTEQVVTEAAVLVEQRVELGGSSVRTRRAKAQNPAGRGVLRAFTSLYQTGDEDVSTRAHSQVRPLSQRL